MTDGGVLDEPVGLRRLIGAKRGASHRREATRDIENTKLLRVRATVAKLRPSTFRRTCKTQTAMHGGHETDCKLFGRHGFLRHMGCDVGVAPEELAQVRAFYPKEKFV